MIQTITFYQNPNDILDSYKKDVDCRNTWDDWHILAKERPVFTPPTPKNNFIEVPGGNGSLDLTESLAGYPTYSDRTGSFTFRVMNDYIEDGKVINEQSSKGRWAERYSEIMDYIHGKRLYAVLPEDPTWFYVGRFSVSSWSSGETWSEITIEYTVNPFKWSISSSTSDWLWDPFNFNMGVTWDSCCTDIVINNPETWSSISIPSYTIDSESMKEFFGKVPLSPTITYQYTGREELDPGIDIRFINTYLNIDFIEHFTEGTTYVPDFLFYGQSTPYEIQVRGTGKISIDFRVGRL